MKQKIDFRSGACAVIMRLPCPGKTSEKLFNDKAFPGASRCRMRPEVLDRRDPQQRMQQPRVADKHLRRFDQPFLCIRMPGSQDTYDECFLENVEIVFDRRRG